MCHQKLLPGVSEKGWGWPGIDLGEAAEWKVHGVPLPTQYTHGAPQNREDSVEPVHCHSGMA